MLRAASTLYKAPLILAQSAVAVSVTGTLTETTLATITVPGGMMGPNGSLRILPIWSCTNSANNKTFKVSLGATVFFNAVQTTILTLTPLLNIRNRGAANSQVGFPANNTTGLGTSGAAVVTGAIDTTINQSLTITGTLANTGETITLEGYTVELLPS